MESSIKNMISSLIYMVVNDKGSVQPTSNYPKPYAEKLLTSKRLSPEPKGLIKEYGDLRLLLRIPFLIALRE